MWSLWIILDWSCYELDRAVLRFKGLDNSSTCAVVSALDSENPRIEQQSRDLQDGGLLHFMRLLQPEERAQKHRNTLSG